MKKSSWEMGDGFHLINFDTDGHFPPDCQYTLTPLTEIYRTCVVAYNPGQNPGQNAQNPSSMALQILMHNYL